MIKFISSPLNVYILLIISVSHVYAQKDTIIINFDCSDEIENLTYPHYIPIYNFKDTVFFCGDPIEKIINFDYIQKGIVFFKDKNINKYSYRREPLYKEFNYAKDYTKGLQFRIRDAKYIVCYMDDHPDDFIFGLSELKGFWVIRNNRMYKLIYTYGGFFRLTLANRYCRQFSSELITDMMSDEGIALGRRYKPCPKKKYPKHKVYLKVMKK